LRIAYLTCRDVTELCFLSSSGEEERPQFAQEAKGIGLSAKDDMPEWRKASFGGKKVSYGKKTNLSILEQRQSLPIYKLRDELVKVRNTTLHNNCLLRT
jgi:ATP-dependent RNA helicase DHX8/PRP22